MSVRSWTLAATLLMGLAACTESDSQAGEHAAANTAASRAGCIPPGGAVITGAGVGGVHVGAPAEEVRRACDIVGDTALVLEGEPQPALRIALGGDTVLAEVVDGRIWRVRVVRPGLRTADSLGVGTPVRRLAELPGATVARGEGGSFVLAPTHCGLSFAVEDLPVRARRWTVDELAAMPDSIRVRTILVLGGCEADARDRSRADTSVLQ